MQNRINYFLQYFVIFKPFRIIYTDFFFAKKQKLRNSIFLETNLIFSNKYIFVHQVTYLLWYYGSRSIKMKYRHCNAQASS